MTQRTKPRSAAPRRYYVEYERVDIWFVPVLAHNKKEAAEKVRRSEFDVKDTQHSYYGGDGKILTVQREEDW